VKKLLAGLGLGSVGAFIAAADKVCHFALFDLLAGSRAFDAEAAAKEKVYSAIKWISALLLAMTHSMFDHPLVWCGAGGIVAAAALVLSKGHRLDFALLLTIAVGSVALSLFAVSPWLRVSEVLQDRALMPNLIVTENSYMGRHALANWRCVICAHVTASEYSDLTCSKGMSLKAAADTLSGNVATITGLTILLVIAFAAIFWARGDWLRIEAGAGTSKAILAVLSVITYVALALNVYSVAYVYGKTANMNLAQYTKMVGDERVIGFALAKSDKRITFMTTLADIGDVEPGSVMALNKSADIIDYYLSEVAKRIMKSRKEMNNASVSHTSSDTAVAVP